MAANRFKKVFGVLAVFGLLLGTSGVVAGSASAHGTKPVKYSSTGTADSSTPGNTIDTNGNFSVTVDGTGPLGVSSTSTVSGSVATGAGIGKMAAKTTSTPDAGGNFGPTTVAFKKSVGA